MDVSIIIVNYRSPQLLRNCLRSVFDHTKGVSFEIIIVDNDSPNGGSLEIARDYPATRVIAMGYNAGFGRANNKGMQGAKGRYFLLLNADTLLTFDVISRCVQRLDKQADIVACSATQLYLDGSPIPYYTSFNDIRKTFFIIPPSNFLQKMLDSLLPEPVYSDKEQHDWLTGAFMMVRREAFTKTGGFDNELFMYGEDLEWSWRLGKLGKLCYFKDCQFIHLENPSPFRRTNVSWINRLGVQMQVSNMVWLRNQYGRGFVTLLMLHYILMVPIVYIWRMLMNLKEGKSVLDNYKTQRIFRQKIAVLNRYYWRMMFAKNYFYKIKPEENIDEKYA